MIWVVVLCHQLHTETGNRISNLKLKFQPISQSYVVTTGWVHNPELFIMSLFTSPKVEEDSSLKTLVFASCFCFRGISNAPVIDGS